MATAREINLVELVPLVGKDALTFQAIARSLHKLAEIQCNYGLTPAQEEREAHLVAMAQAIAQAHRLVAYRQGDPRGWPLYLLTPEQAKTADSAYDRGVAVCPH